MAITIYALTDPDGAIRYVGKTSQRLGERVSQHKASAKKGRGWLVSRWIASLLSSGLEPGVVVLEVVPVDQWEEAEARWISKCWADGCKLTNTAAGGCGPVGYRHSVETRQRMRAAKLGKKASQQARENMRGRVMTPEVRLKISLSKKGNVVISEAQREHARRAQTGRKWTDEQRRSRSELLRSQWADGGARRSNGR